MATKSAFSIVGLAHKVCLSAEAQGYTPELLNELAEHPTLLSEILKIQRGHAEVKPIEHLVDFDAAPFIPDGWTVLPDGEQLPNRVRGKVKFDPTKVKLHLDAGQNRGKYIEGNTLRTKLASAPVYGAQLLDFYLANPHLIPEGWKNQYVFFWGTIYRRSDGGLYVRSLDWGGARWDWYAYWLGLDWHDDYPAVVSAS